MSRILSIDYGAKKVGLAMSDETQAIALPFLIIENIGKKNLIGKIKNICQKKDVEKIIIGLPKTLAGGEGNQAQEVKAFAAELEKEIKLLIIFRDERLTSKMAQRFIEKNKKQDDRIAAQILLQDYLDKSQEHENKRT